MYGITKLNLLSLSSDAPIGSNVRRMTYLEVKAEKYYQNVMLSDLSKQQLLPLFYSRRGNIKFDILSNTINLVKKSLDSDKQYLFLSSFIIWGSSKDNKEKT